MANCVVPSFPLMAKVIFYHNGLGNGGFQTAQKTDGGKKRQLGGFYDAPSDPAVPGGLDQRPHHRKKWTKQRERKEI